MYEDWVTRDYGGDGKAVSLSKSCLGDFVMAVMVHGGRITSSYCMNAKYPRSYCQFSIELPKGKKDEFERASGFALEKPPYLVPA